jgi:lipid II:glycine glycyltransferase (peptidoglycan interpeptide bridge formation enzyme)
LKILHNNDIPRDLWSDLLAQTSFSSPFHTPEYFNFLKDNEGSNPIVLALEESDILRVLMVISIMKEPGIKGFFSRRGIIFGGPLIFEATSKELFFFFSETERILKRKAIYLETRNFFDYSGYLSSFTEAGWAYEPYLNIQINLEGIGNEELLSSFKYNRRREIKQSISNGASYHLSEKKEEILSVYQILKELYRENIKLPLPTFDFFYEFYESGILKVFVVVHEGKIIGGSFCPVLAEKGLYTYYYCGLRNYHKQIFPTHLAVLASIEYAIENFIPKVDFMGAGKPGVEYGVRTYKLEFGGDLVEHGRFIKVLNPFLYKLGKFGLKVLKVIS